MTPLRAVILFVLAALAEIGGAYLVWQGIRENRGIGWVGAGVVVLGAYGFIMSLQPDPNFSRIMAAYGGIFIAAALAWGAVFDGFRPDKWDIIGAIICLLGAAVIMWGPREAALDL